MKGYIYCILENEKPIYVGCTQNLGKRITEHITNATHTTNKQQPIHKHMQEVGIENFEFKVLRLHDFKDINDMYEAEAYYINEYGTYKSGFNFNSGGNSTAGGSKNPNARAVRCVETGEEFDCIQRACHAFGLGITEMSSHLTGKRYQNGIGRNKLGKAYRFEYVNRDSKV